MGLWDNIPIVKAKAYRNSSLASYLDSKNASDKFLSSTSNSVLNNNTVGDQRFALPDYGYPDLSKNRIVEAPVSGVGLSSVGEFNMNNPLEVNKPITNPINTGYVAGSGPAPKGTNPSSLQNLFSSIDTSTLSNPASQEQAAPSMSDQFKQDNYNVPDVGLDENAGSGFDWDKTVGSKPYSFMDNFTDFSSKDAAKNSLENISTGVDVGTSLFNAYSKYQSNKAKADYQNRIAGLYEKQYNDTEARRANAQANYDASVPK